MGTDCVKAIFSSPFTLHSNCSREQKLSVTKVNKQLLYGLLPGFASFSKRNRTEEVEYRNHLLIESIFFIVQQDSNENINRILCTHYYDIIY